MFSRDHAVGGVRKSAEPTGGAWWMEEAVIRWLGLGTNWSKLSECLWARSISPVWLEVNMRQVTGMTGMTSSSLSGLSTSRLGGH